jgi:hypothetical protein
MDLTVIPAVGGLIFGAAGLWIALDERGHRRSAESRAELRDEERLERERRADLPDLRISTFTDNGRIGPAQDPAFLVRVSNWGVRHAAAVCVELWPVDDPDATWRSSPQAVQSNEAPVRFEFGVPQDWTIPGGRALRPDIRGRVVDDATGAEASFHP